ncbi:MAG TPA: integrase arm-type DNA-binding domain-containing protein [Mesorhizobium sp.]|nr:integrase arm-type DNA-binding domain-containing protein [Mesorhizobium sp.]
MPRENLTDKRLKALKPAPAGQRYEIMDGIVPGMGIRVTDKGQKSFVFVARYPGSSNPTRRALGEYDALTLDAARDKAREWHGLISRGIDPKVKQEEERQAAASAASAKRDRSFETVLDRFIAARRRDGIRKADEDERDFKRECLPKWKGRDVADLKGADIMAVLEAIAERGKTRQALNMAQKIGTFFSWCADDELIDTSPYRAKKVRTSIGEKAARDRVFTDAELWAFWRATEGLEPVYRGVYRLLLLTGQRLNDIAQASWSEIDTTKKVLTVPADRFKSGRDHAVPLTDDAAEIIEALPRFEKSKWLCSLDGKHPVHIGHKLKQRLDKAMLAALQEEDEEATLPAWVNHDIRRTVRTRLSELDVMDEVAEAVIGHVPSALIRTYNQSDRMRVKRDALNRWQGALNVIVGRGQDANVIPLVGRAQP